MEEKQTTNNSSSNQEDEKMPTEQEAKPQEEQKDLNLDKKEEESQSKPAFTDQILDVEPAKDQLTNEFKDEQEVDRGEKSFKQPEKKSFSPFFTILGIILIILLFAWYFQEEKNIQLSNQTIKDVFGIDEKVTVKVDNKQEEGKVNIIDQTTDQLANNQPATAENASNTGEKVKITAYYVNVQKAGSDCNVVFPLEREIEKKYDSDIVNALRGLLTSLSAGEKSQGYGSYVPAGTMLKYVKINGSEAEVHFTESIRQTNNDCAAAAVKAQVENTLKQFSYIQSVKICAGDSCD